jgi:hypothetical protein
MATAKSNRGNGLKLAPLLMLRNGQRKTVFNMAIEGVTYITFASMLCGLLAHSLKQLIAAKRNKAGLKIIDYYVENLPETLLATVSALVLWFGLPEIAELFPDLARVLGVTDRQTVLSSFVVGFMANSLADFLGGRARSIGGG